MSQPLFDKDVESLLMEKIAYHREQSKLHARMAQETQDKLNILTNKSRLISTPMINTSPVEQTNLSIQLPLDLNFSVTIWKPRVERVLKASEIALKNEDILKNIDPRYLESDALRSKATAAISSSLFSLVEKKLVEKLPSEGKGNLYKWIQ